MCYGGCDCERCMGPVETPKRLGEIEMDKQTWSEYYECLKRQVDEAKEDLDRAQGAFDALATQLTFANAAKEKAERLVKAALANRT